MPHAMLVLLAMPLMMWPSAAITHIIAMLASSHTASTTACLCMVPLAYPDTMERGDIVASARGLLCPRPHDAPIPSKLIPDFILCHACTSFHSESLEQGTLEEMERDQNAFYLTSQNIMKRALPLPLGGKFLWTLAIGP